MEAEVFCTADHLGGERRILRRLSSLGLLALISLLLLPLHDSRLARAPEEFERSWRLFVHGDLVPCQFGADLGAKRFKKSDPVWAARFQLLEAEILLTRGMFKDALALLSSWPESRDDIDSTIQKLALESAVLTRLQRFHDADQRLVQAERLCQRGFYRACGDVLRARGVLAIDSGQIHLARQYFLQCLSFAERDGDRYLEATARLNLGVAALQSDRYDEAVDWSKAADRVAISLDAEYLAEKTEGNLAWSYFALGDHDRALMLFLDAQKRATNLGSLRDQLKWLENIGFVYQADGDPAHAEPVYRQALELAKRIDSKADIAITLEDLAFAAIDAGAIEEANSYLDQLIPLVNASNNHGDALWVELARGRIAAQRREDGHAETLLRAVLKDHESPTSMRLSAGDQLALLHEAEGHGADADRTYRSTLSTFEQARNQLKNEDSRLPFLANATPIYDDYVHFLVHEGRPLPALAIADQSRARTLEQGLGVGSAKPSAMPAAFDPPQIARATESTLLFYWLGKKQSYLWAITPAKVELFTLPPQQQIAARVESYRKVLLDLRDPLAAGNTDGQALYQMLVAPAAAMIPSNKPVILLDEGILSKLNFETLLVPGYGPNSNQTPDPAAQFHYLIDDLTFSSAPSLAMLAATKPASDTRQRMLLLGNPVSPDRDFPTLPMFSFEMSRVESHFAAAQMSTFDGRQATPVAYVASKPEQYSYIHFVTHAVANSTSPLDSAIILSNPAGQEDSYKLYAREIIQHPIGAKLVTISACYGSGTRAYAGEGLVGLSWAFLRAGAHKVIGALWEVSDDSTPRLMDTLYQGLANGESPAVALRSAKLALLHSQSRFRIPFYWAPFQIYGRQ